MERGGGGYKDVVDGGGSVVAADDCDCDSPPRCRCRGVTCADGDTAEDDLRRWV